MPATEPRLLILGEDEDVGQKYRFYLKGLPYHTTFAEPDTDLIQKLKETSADLLILDSDHLHEHAHLILDSLHQQKIRLPIVIVTSEQNPEVVQKIAPNVKEFVLKPINGNTLQERINKALSRWQREVQLEADIGKNVGVHLQTRILVAFRDSAIIERVRKDGLLLYKEQPIIPNTTIYFKAGTLFKTMGIDSNNISPLKLTVKRCDRVEGAQYRVLSEFKEMFSFQEVVDAFVEGRPLPKISEEVSEQMEADASVDEFFMGELEDNTEDSFFIGDGPDFADEDWLLEGESEFSTKPSSANEEGAML